MEILETRIIPDRIGGKESPLVTVEFNCAGGESIAVTLQAGRGLEMAETVERAKAMMRVAAGAEPADMQGNQQRAPDERGILPSAAGFAPKARPPAPPHLETMTRRLASHTRRW